MQPYIPAEWELSAFVGKKAGYYIEQWEKGGGLNWAAFFFGIDWLVYRKMYIEAACVYLVMILSQALSFMAGISVSPVLVRLLIGVFLLAAGNGLYYKKAVRTMVSFGDLNREQSEPRLRKQGGISIFSVLIFEALAFAVSFFT